ncbi:hypothetical protein EDC01DRAFT_725712 [Geopyxis carbonaria]|nr:hypothetical protein EDC01DRAFT_725712 [Geopyxis carbonaria]
MTAVKPTLIIATEDSTYDTTPWIDEGYRVHYIPSVHNRSLIEDVVDDLETSDKYAIIAFGSAALAALTFAITPSRNLVALAAYHPPSLPAGAQFHPSVRVLLHLSESTPFSPATSPTLAVRTYPDGDPHNLAFPRTLALLRSTIGPASPPDLESLADAQLAKHPLLSTPGVRMEIVAQTVGVDRVVVEARVRFTHDREIPLLLEGVGLTNREVQVDVVVITTVRAGEVVGERWVWDQAAVIGAVGLLEDF